MTSLPLSIIGVVIGMVITRVQLSMFVMIGIIMLMGMVVNNAIVLLDFVASMRQKGIPLREALIEAGGSRLRPILMTTLTTVLGGYRWHLQLAEEVQDIIREWPLP